MWPQYSDDEIDAVTEVLRSGRVNYWNGPHGQAFERDFAAYCGVKYGVAVANGTVALELALRALGISAGDDVIVTPRSFFASASAIVACGARPVFADVDFESQNVTAHTIEAALTPETRAIVVVHLAGWPCDMPEILKLCKARELRVVEDCAQAHGAAIAGQRVGSFGDAAAFSFCTDKIMSTGGEGGMLVTNDEAIWQKSWSYKDHGKSFHDAHRSDHPPGFRWLHESFGTNWRLTEMQAAIGRLQLEKLEGWLMDRARNARMLANLLATEDALRVPMPPSTIRNAWYRFYCFIRPEALKADWSRDRVIAEMEAQGQPCFSGSCPEIYLERAFSDHDVSRYQRLPVAHELGETSFSFLVDPAQTQDQLKTNALALMRIIKRARKD